MSELSVKNEFVPYFEPPTKPRTSKRKRNSNIVYKEKEDSKRAKPKAKRTSPSVTPPLIAPRTVVWIGAAVIQEQSLAAYSLYYGLNDKRNVSEKVDLKPDQNLDHIYIMGINCALQQCEDENSLLSIYTGIEDNQEAMEIDSSSDERCKEIKDILAKRKGNTLINFKNATTQNKSSEYSIAHQMAEDKLKKVDILQADVDETVESLSIVDNKQAYKEVAVKEIETEDVVMADIQDIKTDEDNQDKKKEDGHQNQETSEDNQDESSVTATEDEVECPKQIDKPTSWTSSFNLGNLLSVLAAPFRRGNTN